MSERTGSSCHSILVVEDDADTRGALMDAIEDQGYRVLGAAHGREALAILSQVAAPCLILVDLMMPVMNGWELIDVLRQEQSLAQIPVVVVSAYEGQAVTATVAGFIKKPVTLSDLSKVIARFCPVAQPAAQS